MYRIPVAFAENDRCVFNVWAPQKERMQLHIVKPKEEVLEMHREKFGYFRLELGPEYTGCWYFYRPDDEGDFADPASCYQPQGVGGPSELLSKQFNWTDISWRNYPLKEYVMYELHVGTFTPEGTFEAAIGRLGELVDLGVNAIEIMPVGQFPGERNWGYDGVFPYAAQHSYGGPYALKKLVNACHEKGIAVILDVVYNHFGPEGNCLAQFAPYFTDKYHTPWGASINFDGPNCDGVREYFCGNALYWLEHFHIDALRLDAIHEMYDYSAFHFWEYLHNHVRALGQKLGKNFYLIAESDLNNPKIVQHPSWGGYGFNAQWLDDFHHALYVMIYPKGSVLYVDFGDTQQVAKAYTDGFVHSGQFVEFREKRFGRSSAGLPGESFIVFIQNHDQVGNTVDGSRLSVQVDWPILRVAAAAYLLAPYIPMLFMGEEYGEDAPFCYFVDHSGEELIDAVRKGRREEFAKSKWEQDPPDPKSTDTFTRSKLQWNKRNVGRNLDLLNWYRQLIKLRKTHNALCNFNRDDTQTFVIADNIFALYRRSADGKESLFSIFNLTLNEHMYRPLRKFNGWSKLLSSVDGWPDQLIDCTIPPQSVGIYSNQE